LAIPKNAGHSSQEQAPSINSPTVAPQPNANAVASIRCTVTLQRYDVHDGGCGAKELKSSTILTDNEVCVDKKLFEVLPVDYQQQVNRGYSPFGGSRQHQIIYRYFVGCANNTFDISRTIANLTFRDFFNDNHLNPSNITLFIRVEDEGNTW